MLVEEQLSESSPQSSNSPRVLHDTTSNGTEHPAAEDKNPTYFIAKVRTLKGSAYLLLHITPFSSKSRSFGIRLNIPSSPRFFGRSCTLLMPKQMAS